MRHKWNKIAFPWEWSERYGIYRVEECPFCHSRRFSIKMGHVHILKYKKEGTVYYSAPECIKH